MGRTKRFLSRLALLAILVAAIQLSGCASLLGPSRMALPSGFAQQQSAQLLNPATRTAAYQTLFPPMPDLYMTGVTLTVSSGQWHGSSSCSLLYFAQDKDNIRVRGYKQSSSLFDLILRGGFMTVLFPGRAEAYQGRLTSGESPFGRRFGVEPWDLIPVFSIGQWIACGKFTQADSGGKVVLTPQSEVDCGGIQSVELDARSGLPRKLVWEGDQRHYTVLYREWANYEDEKTEGPARLMPKKVQIEQASQSGRVRLTVGKYRFGKPPEQIFTPVETFPYEYHPLEDMNGILDQL